MAKRKQHAAAEAAERLAQAAAAAAAAPEQGDADDEDQQPAKRRRAVSPPLQAPRPARGQSRSAAAAAAAGRAESDDDGGSSGSGGDSGSEDADGEGLSAAGGSEAEDAEQSDGAGSQHEQDDSGHERTWRGVTKSGNLFVVHVRVPQPGGAPPLRTRLGAWPTREAAARVHDAAQIAILGPKAAQPALNFPLAHYRGSRQLFGPELAALLQRLSDEGDPRRRRGGKPKRRRGAPKGRWTATEERREALRAQVAKMHAAKQAKAAQGLPRAKEAVQQARRADPLWVSANARGARAAVTCGVCPACRQPWRTDLGACQRVAVAKAAGHDEGAIVGLLAADPAYRAAALDAFNERRRQQQQQQEQQQPAQQQQQGAQQQQQRGRERTGQVSPAASSPGSSLPPSPRQRRRQQRGAEAAAGEGEGPELEWLEPAPKAISTHVAARLVLQRLRVEAAAALQQQAAQEEGQLAAALERERLPGAPPAARHATAFAGGGGDALTDAELAAAEAASRAAAAHPELVDPGSWLTRASVPGNAVQHEGLPELLQLAALCREGGVEAPMVPELAGEALGDAEQQQEAQQRLVQAVRRLQQQRQQRAGEGEEGDHAAEAAEAAAREELHAAIEAAAEVAEVAGTSGRAQNLRCQLCGGKHPGRLGLAVCPVAQMAMALHKPPPECPGCAGQEQPGCKQCGGGDSAAAARGWTRRAPWLEAVPPGTRDLMEAAQALATAAVADLDVPAVAWGLTPKALLAVGLLAEEAARLQVAARFPPAAAAALPAPGLPAWQQAQQAQQQRHPAAPPD